MRFCWWQAGVPLFLSLFFSESVRTNPTSADDGGSALLRALRRSLLVGELWLLLQALLAVIWLSHEGNFAVTTFAEALFVCVTPFISDLFDTLKDTVFAALCLQSNHLLLKVVGILSWAYLLLIHVYFLLEANTLTELVGCYLPALMAMPETKVTEAASGTSSCYESLFQKCIPLLSLLYKQMTPTKRHLLILENVPQAVGAIIFLKLEGGSFFVGVINLIIPGVQILATYLLFHPLRAWLGPELGRKLALFLEKPDFLKAKQLWTEARGHQRARADSDSELCGVS